MLKRILSNKCTLCAMSLTSPLIKNHRNLVSRYEGFQFNRPFQPNKILKKNHSKEPRHRSFVRVKDSHVSAVRLLLERFNVDMNELDSDKSVAKSIFAETTYTIERRIMLLQEMGVSKIKLSYLANFIKGMYFSVHRFKASFTIDADFDVAQSMLSYVKSSNMNLEAIKEMYHLKDDMSMKQYYTACFVHYLKTELNLNDNQVKRISYKKFSPILYNSFRLVQKTLEIIKDVPLTTPTVIKNRFIFALHPDQALNVIKIIREDLNLTNTAIKRYPKLLVYDLDDLKTLVTYFKQYEITTRMIVSCYKIFHLSSAEFKKRAADVLSNPFTLVYQTHPRFLHLLLDYHVILPRIQYLREKNLKFASIYTLTTYHNYLEKLVTKKKVNAVSIKSFLQSQFGLKAEELFMPLSRHEYYAYAPLVQNYDTLTYLKELYPKEAIYKHIYAILYNKLDLEAARESIINNAEYSQWSPDQVLALCVYKVETNTYFSGEAVLHPEKYAERLKEELSQEKSAETDCIEK